MTLSSAAPGVTGAAPAADGDAAAKAVRNAEAVGHRRVLAGEAHGSLMLDSLGRFEVNAMTRADGRVEVHVRAEHRDGAAMLDKHAAELRADVRIEIPRAFIAVQDVPGEAPAGTSSRSSGREPEGREERADRHAEQTFYGTKSVTGATRATEPATSEASNLRRSARVRIVL